MKKFSLFLIVALIALLLLLPLCESRFSFLNFLRVKKPREIVEKATQPTGVQPTEPAVTPTQEASLGDNHPPNKPVIQGPRLTRAIPIFWPANWRPPPYWYNVTVSDPDPGDNRLRIRFECGEGELSTWGCCWENGETARMHCYWRKPGFKKIRAQAIDSHGAESEWAEMWVFVRRPRLW